MSLHGHMCMQEQSKLEAAVIFLDAVVTQVSAAHLQAGAARHEGILRELESLLQEVREGLDPGDVVVVLVRGLADLCILFLRSVICILFVFSALCICCYPVAAFMPRIRHGGRLVDLQAVGRRCKSFSFCHERSLDWHCTAMVPFKRNLCCRCWLQDLQIQCWQPGTAEVLRRLLAASLPSPT